MNPAQEKLLLEAIRYVDGLILDFDGPICDVFASYPATAIAEKLRGIVRSDGHDLAPALVDLDDPLELLRIVGQHYAPDVTIAVDTTFRQAELEAVRGSIPTSGTQEVIESALASGRELAVVSNNSRDAVMAYLQAHDLSTSFSRIVGRYEGMDPALLKPSRHLVDLAIEATSWHHSSLVGDSVTDIEAATAAGIGSIGYANKAGKDARMADAGAAAVIYDMSELVKALKQVPREHE